MTLHDEIWRGLPAGAGARSAAVHERVLDVARRERQGRVLDVGCGDGPLAARLGAAGARRHRASIPRPLRSSARAPRTRELDLRRARARTAGCRSPTPASTSSRCVHVLEHVADTQPLLSEVRRVLVAAGCSSSPCRSTAGCKNALVALPSFERHHDPLEPVLRFYTARLAARAARRDFGFERIEVSGRGGPPLLRETLVGTGRRAGLD